MKHCVSVNVHPISSSSAPRADLASAWWWNHMGLGWILRAAGPITTTVTVPLSLSSLFQKVQHRRWSQRGGAGGPAWGRALLLSPTLASLEHSFVLNHRALDPFHPHYPQRPLWKDSEVLNQICVACVNIDSSGLLSVLSPSGWTFQPPQSYRVSGGSFLFMWFPVVTDKKRRGPEGINVVGEGQESCLSESVF